MRKRPLCMAVLVVVVVLWLLPAKIWFADPDLEGKSPPETLRGKVWRLETRANGQTVYLRNSNISDTGTILVYLDAEPEISIGNTLSIRQPFTLQEPEPPGNPGQFDARLYYQTQGIVLLCYGKRAEVINENVDWLPQFLYELRGRLGEQCSRLLAEKESGVLRAMLLGDKAVLLPEVKEIYQKSGMSHLLSISGLHVSLIGMSLYRFLRRLGCSYPAAGLPSMCFVLLYGNMTGMSVSTARAVVMLMLAVGADILGKSYDMLTALATAALLLLLEQPLYARSASFLLSFGAVLGIGFFYPALQSLFPVSRKISQTLLLNLSIQILTFPLIQYFYYEFSVYSIFLNLCVIPLMGMLMISGILALSISFFSLSAAGIPAAVCKAILFLYEELGRWTLSLPGAVIICGRPEIWQIVMYYAGIVLFVIWRSGIQEKEKKKSAEELEREERDAEKRRQNRKTLWRIRGCCAFVFWLLNFCLFLRYHQGLTFTMLDVGQGDGLFLRIAGGTTCLIDGGSSDVEEVGVYRIQPFLKSRGIRRLDYVFVTHTDADHISGIQELLMLAGKPGSVQIGTLLLSPQALKEEAGLALKKLAKSRGIEVRIFRTGMCLQDTHTKIVCLHPKPEADYEDTNAGSLVLQVAYEEFSMLLMGDLGETGEQEILDRWQGSSSPCDVLKVGHHGSRFSTSKAFLDMVKPKVALISCKEGNSYGHPHKETLERLKEVKSKSLVTTECGAITVSSDGRDFWVKCFKDR